MRFTATQLWQIKEALREELKEMRMFDPTKEMGAQGLSSDETTYYEPGMEDEGGIDPGLEDFWMNELNTALIASAQQAGSSLKPSDFLEAILPVLQAYGSGKEAEDMVKHVRNNQDIYSPRGPK